MKTLVKPRTSRWFEKELHTLSVGIEHQLCRLLEEGDEDYYLPRLFTPNPMGKISHRDSGYPLAVLTEVCAKNGEVLIENELGDSIEFNALPMETQLDILKTVEQNIIHRKYLDENSY